MKWSYNPNPEIFPSNEKINELNDKIRELKKKYNEELKTLQEEVDKIQKKCDHHYHMTASSCYDDHYECKFCGHETMR